MTVRHLAAGGFSGLLLTLVTVHATASAAPVRSPEPAARPDGLTRPCFLEQMHWNAALDGPEPRCPTWAASHPEPTIVLRRALPVP